MVSDESILQELAFPEHISDEDYPMYFRINNHEAFLKKDKIILINKNNYLYLDTFFNMIPVSHWKNFTIISHFSIDFVFKGEIEVYLYLQNNTLSGPRLISSGTFKSLDADKKQRIFNKVECFSKGYLFFVIKGLSDSTILKNYFITAENVQPEKISLAIIMCTFRREEFVKKNVKTILESFDNNLELFQNSKLFLVDNGKTLTFPTHKNFELIPNRNLGGSGGFGRGMFEVYKNEKSFTHFLLCDDDIILDSETLRRTMRLLSVLKDPKLSLHGAMLSLEKPSVISASGEFFESERFRKINKFHGLDVKDQKSLQLLSNPVDTNFAAWWFTVYPVSDLKEIGFPVPFFVKWDDVDFGLRRYSKGYYSIPIPGIAIWHPSFNLKYSLTIDSYLTNRNRLILQSIHKNRPGKRFAPFNSPLLYTFKNAFGRAISKRYQSAEYILKAIEHYLDGPSCIEKSPEILINNLRSMENESAKILTEDQKRLLSSLKFQNKDFTESRIRKLIRWITLNGHFLYFFNKKKISIPMYHQDLRLTFGTATVLYWGESQDSIVGFTVNHSNKKFWSIISTMIVVGLKALLRTKKVSRDYEEAFPYLTSYHFWKKYLELNDN